MKHLQQLQHLRQDPPATLFYHRNDPNDRRLGELVKSDLAAYAAADIVLLGYPYDEGSRRNQARTGAAAGPNAIREQFYKLTILGMETLQLFDLGDTATDGSLEEIHERHQALVQQVISDGKRLIVLGGANDVSYPDVAGLAQVMPDLLALNVDAHLDVRADTPRNNGTPYRQLLVEGYLAPNRFFEVGYQPSAASPVYLDYLTQLGVQCFSRSAVQAQGVDALIGALLQTSAQAIFWGIDIDAVTAADAPGTSAPNAAGLFAHELIRLAELAGADPRSRLLEISEVSPPHDLDSRTSRLAAVAIWHFIQSIPKGSQSAPR
jgi:formiminoglutamase